MGYARKGPQVVDVDQEAVLSKVGANIQDRRLKAGLTQRDLAEQAGVDRAFLNRVEQGMRNPTIVLLAKLARAMDTTVSTLARGV
jgi:transcriptional regulator with XRE-family HTH domain